MNNNYLNEFIAYLSSEKGLSENTIEAYSRDLQAFLKERNPLTVTAENVMEFLTLLKMKQYAPATMARMLISLKVFFRFLQREKIIEENPTLLFETPKLWQLIPKVLSVNEIEGLLQLPDIKTAQGARDRAILEVLYGSGIRVSELCSLKLHDFGRGTIRVMGKGKKERIVPLGKKAFNAIDHYLLHFRDRHVSEFLFVNRKGQKMDRFAIWRMVKKYAKKGGITNKLSPHVLRHSFATHLLNNGADLRIIQELLGHGHIGTTDKYTHVNQTKIQDSFSKFHPRG